MGLVTDFLLGRVTQTAPAEREAAPSPFPMLGFTPSGGVMPYAVDSYTSLGLSSVWRSLDILCNSISQLDWRECRGTLDLPPSRLVRRPSEQITRRDWVSRVVESMALYDVAYLIKSAGTDSEGVPVSLWPLDPALVGPATVYSPMLYPPTEYNVAGTIVPAEDMVVIRRSMHASIPDNLSGIMRLARTTLSAAISSENYAARYWQSGGSPTTVLETEQRLMPAQKSELSDAWRTRKAMGPDYAPVMDGGITARQYGADPTQESAVEARRELVADVGRYFGIPTRILNAPTGDSQTYHNSAAGRMDLLTYTLQNYIDGIEDAITDLLPGGRCMCMDTWPLTRTDPLSEAQAYQLATSGAAWMTVEDVRDRLGLPPMEPSADDLMAENDPTTDPMPMGAMDG